MKNGWKIVPMGKLCSISSGESDTQDAVPDGPYVFFDRSKTIKRSSRFLYDCEALIIPGEGKEFLPKHFKGKFDLHQRAYALFEFLPELNVRFLYYLLHYRSDYFPSVAVGATVKSLRRRHFENLPIPVPPLPEQERIVGILDEAFEGIATAKAIAEKNFQNARALFESYLESVFAHRGPGWVEKPLGEVCAITSTLVDPRKKEFLDLIHVGAGNIESKTGIFVDLKTAREEGLISGKFLFDDSMVLYSKIRPYLMKVARPDFDGLCSADMYPLAPLPNEITRDYLFHLLLSKRFTDYAIQGSARAGMPKVNREHLFDFKVWLPEVKKQKELAAKLDELHEETQRLESIYDQKLAALDALKKTLLHQAFTGEIRKTL
jgi:type I restriction enzyme, S subunit